jgi:hypothetical protein
MAEDKCLVGWSSCIGRPAGAAAAAVRDVLAPRRPEGEDRLLADVEGRQGPVRGADVAGGVLLPNGMVCEALSRKDEAREGHASMLRLSVSPAAGLPNGKAKL